jgi:hypothetical protein
MTKWSRPIYAPTIYLFAFQFRDKLPWEVNNTFLSQDWLVQKYRQILDKYYAFKTIKFELKKSWVEPAGQLQNHSIQARQEQNFLGTIKTNKGLEIISGKAYPQLIDDSYVVELKLHQSERSRKKGISIRQLKDYNPKGCFLPRKINTNLGQTLAIATVLAEGEYLEKAELKLLADRCIFSFLHSFALQEKPIFTYSGNLFNGYIFVYKLPEHIYKYNQIIVYFFLREEDIERWQKHHHQLAQLWLYQHKIVYAHQYINHKIKLASHQLNKLESYLELHRTKYNYSSLSSVLSFQKNKNKRQKKVSINLKQLEYQLKLIQNVATEYNRLLLEIKHYHGLLLIYRKKYQQELELFNQKRSFFTYFWEQKCSELPQEIRTNLTFLEQGSQRFQQIINKTISLIEIEKADRILNLRNTIAVVGVGLGVANIFAISYSTKANFEQFQETLPQTLEQNENWYFATKYFVQSISVGLLAAIITFILIKLWQKNPVVRN